MKIAPKKNCLMVVFFLLNIVVQAQTTVLQNVQIVDVQSGKVKPHQTVIIEKDRIKKIGKNLNIPRKAQVINAQGKYLIPGLWDMHVHLSMVGETSFPLFIANGVTGVRDMGGDYAKLKRWRIEEKTGKRLMPVFKTPGAILENALWYNAVKGIFGEEELKKERIVVHNPKHAHQIIDSIKSIGVDFVKMRNVIDRKTFFAIADACKKQGLKLVGHLPDRQVSIEEAVKTGFVGLEHAFFFSLMKKTKEERQKVYTTMKQCQVYYTPTLMADENAHLTPVAKTNAIVYDEANKVDPRRQYIHPEMIEFWKLNQEMWKESPPSPWHKWLEKFHAYSKEMHQSGVKILAGVDLPVPPMLPGWSLHQELELLVKKMGLSPLEALRAATLNAAEFMEITQDYGAVVEGKKADLVLLSANPLENISNTQKVTLVIKNGKVYDETAREQMLTEVARQVKQKKQTYVPHKLNRYLKQRAAKKKTLGEKFARSLGSTLGKKVAPEQVGKVIREIHQGKHKIDEAPLLKIAYGLLQAGEIEKAGMLMEANAKMRPQSYRAYKGLGDLLLAMGNKQRAAVFYKNALKLNKQSNETEKKYYKNLKKVLGRLKH
ncbi:amidohydrolase family protein [uncultured Microscilla sp.]|uniref:amidohydrolase family protein n=1 Tax=uncultured Microscilla sp. TaxID=432653 RepID=UPI002636B083|nr:amidohydrolase family protein [uncultured Microscilla sp.]